MGKRLKGCESLKCEDCEYYKNGDCKYGTENIICSIKTKHERNEKKEVKNEVYKK